MMTIVMQSPPNPHQSSIYPAPFGSHHPKPPSKATTFDPLRPPKKRSKLPVHFFRGNVFAGAAIPIFSTAIIIYILQRHTPYNTTNETAFPHPQSEKEDRVKRIPLSPPLSHDHHLPQKPPTSHFPQPPTPTAVTQTLGERKR